MKAYRVAEARAQIGTLLDAAAGGDVVVIERAGVRFRLSVETPSKAIVRAPSAIVFADADVLSGSWTWSAGSQGLRFRSRRRKP